MELQRIGSRGWQRVCRTLAISLACISLFPCVSASDDSVRFRYFESTRSDPRHPDGDHSKKPAEKSLATLVRLLEALESVQVSALWVLAVALGFYILATVQWNPGKEHFLPRRLGRAPPAFSFAV